MEHYSFVQNLLEFWNYCRLWVCLDRTYFAETENWKHCSKIIFKCVNSAVGPIFNEKMDKKWNLWVHEQCMDPLIDRKVKKQGQTVLNSTPLLRLSPETRVEKKKEKKQNVKRKSKTRTWIQTYTMCVFVFAFATLRFTFYVFSFFFFFLFTRFLLTSGYCSWTVHK